MLTFVTIILEKSMTYNELWQQLLPVCDEGEARAVVRWLLDVAFGLSLTDIVCGAVERLSAADERRLMACMSRLAQGEPVQYVVGKADFGPRQFAVTPSVLIPRPETYELCQWAVEVGRGQGEGATLLDLGTGSGCIACTLAADLPLASVTAWDVSAEALAVARQNAVLTGVAVSFVRQDMLLAPPAHGLWNVIVSNPPYVCHREQQQMALSVTGYEPHLALFVPDDDPLLYYRAIGHYAIKALRPGGSLFLEINPLYAKALCGMLLAQGFTSVAVSKDDNQKERYVVAS